MISPQPCRHCGLPVPPSRRDDAAGAPVFCCYGCRIAHDIALPSHAGGGAAPSTLLIRLGAGVFLTMNMMVFNALFTWRHVFDPAAAESAAPLTNLVAYGLMFLCTLVIVLLGVPLAASCRSRLAIDADLLILIGVLAAYALSVINTIRGDDHLYFDTAALILVLLTLGRYLESVARVRATNASGKLLEGMPAFAGGAGDEVDVAVGTISPVDGEVIAGEALIDESILTGESRPRRAAVGDRVLAGSIPTDGLLRLRAIEVGGDRVIARMQAMLEEARLRQPEVSRLADRVAAVFVPAVVGLALVMFVHHTMGGDMARGLLVALSILLISCPCALGLSGPLATWTALGRAAERGILIDSGRTLERMSAVGRVWFDKTGTLTRRRMLLESISGLRPGVTESEALAIAASLEAASRHPIAAAFADEVARRGITPPQASQVALVPGHGLRGGVGRVTYELGRSLNSAEDHRLVVKLRDMQGDVATFVLAEELRDEARQTIALLRAGRIEVGVVTGDQAGPAQRIGRELSVTVHSGLLPADKVRHIEESKAGGRVVTAMVGDGINDAPVLAAADVGIAVGDATDLAKQAGKVHLMGDSLLHVAHAMLLARHAMWRIRWNLVWGFGYNSIGIALAAMDRLNPVIAALAMLGSSLFIIATSRGAGRFDDGPVHHAPTASTPASISKVPA